MKTDGQAAMEGRYAGVGGLSSTAARVWHDGISALGLFVLLFSIYLLSYSGIVHSRDEVLYIRDATRLVEGETRTLGHGGFLTLTLAGILYLTRSVESILPVQAMFVTNAVSTALTAVWIFLCGVQLGYDRRAAGIVALLYGLASPAWVYSKSLFREPLAAMCLMGMLYCLTRFKARLSVAAMVGAMAWLAMAVITRTSVSVVAPFAFLYAVNAVLRSGRAQTTGPQRRQAAALGVMVFFVLASVALGLVFQEYRPYLDRLLSVFQEYGTALTGLLISPGRGLLVYAPIALLALAGLPGFARRHPWETWVLYGSSVCYVFIASAHPMWWGGWNWGPRFLMPFVPFMLFPMIAIFDVVLVERRRRWLVAPVLALVVLSLGMQLIGVTVGANMPAFSNMNATLFSAWSSFPLLQTGHLGSFEVDLAVRYLPRVWPDGALVMLPLLVLAGLGAAFLTGSGRVARHGALGLAGAIAVLALAAGSAVWSVQRYGTVGAAYQGSAGFRRAMAQVLANAQDADFLIANHWKSDELYLWRRFSLEPCRGDCALDEELRKARWQAYPADFRPIWLQRQLDESDRVWLITGGAGSPDRARELEIWLETQAQRESCQDMGQDIKLCIYTKAANDK